MSGARPDLRTIVSRLDVAHNAGSKAPSDVRTVARRLGFAPVDLAPFSRVSRRDRVLGIVRAAAQTVLATPTFARSDVLLTQHPLGRVNDVVLGRTARRTRSILLLHDLESLRRTQYAGRERETLSSYDVIVAHTPAMAEHLRVALPSTPTVVLGSFDYLVEDPCPLPALSPRPQVLYVIGSLALDKAAYLYALGPHALPVRAYGRGCVVERLPERVTWEGVLDMHRPALPARDGFGVVWDGTSPDGLCGQMGQYLRYNAPHKFGMYLALGLPVVVAEGSAMAELVLTERLGLVARTVAEASEAAAACTEQQWQELGASVLAYRERLLSGGQVTAALRTALDLLGTPA